MDIENEFELQLPVDESYALLLDLEKVVPCLPGAELGAENDDGGRAVLVTVKLGPMRFVYDGAVRITDQDPAVHTATLVGEGKEKRGGGTAAATIQMSVVEAGSGSSVRTIADVKLTGRAAQNGRGIVQDVSKALIGQMAETLEERYGGQNRSESEGGSGGRSDGAAPGSVAAAAGPTADDSGVSKVVEYERPPETAPIKVGGLVFKAIWGQIRAFFARIFSKHPAARRGRRQGPEGPDEEQW